MECLIHLFFKVRFIYSCFCHFTINILHYVNKTKQKKHLISSSCAGQKLTHLFKEPSPAYKDKLNYLLNSLNSSSVVSLCEPIRIYVQSHCYFVAVRNVNEMSHKSGDIAHKYFLDQSGKRPESGFLTQQVAPQS